MQLNRDATHASSKKLLRLHFSKTNQFSWNASKTWFNVREPSFRGRSYKALRIYRIWSFGGVKNYIGAAAAVAQWKSARLGIVGSNPVSSQCFETFTRLYSQVCKYRSIFKITSVLKFTAQVYFKFSILSTLALKQEHIEFDNTCSFKLQCLIIGLLGAQALFMVS